MLLGKISALKRRVVDIMSSLDFDGVEEDGDTGRFVKMVEGYMEGRDEGEVSDDKEKHLRELVTNGVGLEEQVQVPIQLTFEPPKKSKVGRKKKFVAAAVLEVEKKV